MGRSDDEMEFAFQSALETGLPQSVENHGFRMHKNDICSYTEERVGFGYFYCKRKVLDDGIETEPLDIWLETELE